LHEWITLVFRPHAQAPLKYQVDNYFHPWFYDTAVTPEVRADQASLSVIREWAACFGVVPAQLFEEAPGPREVYVEHFWNLTKFSPLGKFLPIVMRVEKNSILLVDGMLNFVEFKSQAESMKGKLDLLTPKDLPIPITPIVAISKKFALVAFPWSSSFVVIPIKNGQCGAAVSCRFHTLPLTCLGISENWFVSASRDCSVRLWKIKANFAVKQVHFPTTRAQPVVLLEMSKRMKSATVVTRDGFVMAISLLNGRYLAGIELGMSNPSHLVVTQAGFALVCFNGPDSHVVFVLDQNLLLVTKNTFDGCVQCWTTLEFNGIDFIVLALDYQRILALRVPLLDAVMMEASAPFLPQFIAYLKPDGVCYLSGPRGEVYAMRIG
jgi:hypothetical protein